MSKKNLILGGILIVLIAFSYVWSGPFKNWKANSVREKNFLAAISAAEVNKIEITSAGGKTILEKAGELWRVNGAKDFYVSKYTADALSTILSEVGIKPLETVSAARNKKSSFGTDDQGIKVGITEPGETLDFIVGKNTPDFIGTYISTLDRDKTYSIGLDLAGLFGRTEWRDLTIFSFNKAQAVKIRFQYGKTNFVVEKNNNNKWTGIVPNEFPVSEEKIIAVLGVLENLLAAKIPVQDFKDTGLETNSQIIQVTGAGFDNTLMIGDCIKDDLCYAKRGDSDNIYLITKEQKDALNKKIIDLK